MAQALGGAYGLPHGAMNALCLPPALDFNRRIVPEPVARFGEAVGGDPVERSRELALLGGFERLRDFGVRRDDLPQIAEVAAGRGGNANNPRVATPDEIRALYESIWCGSGVAPGQPRSTRPGTGATLDREPNRRGRRP
jgi:alcohol dehydrogenase class IV